MSEEPPHDSEEEKQEPAEQEPQVAQPEAQKEPRFYKSYTLPTHQFERPMGGEKEPMHTDEMAQPQDKPPAKAPGGPTLTRTRSTKRLIVILALLALLAGGVIAAVALLPGYSVSSPITTSPPHTSQSTTTTPPVEIVPNFQILSLQLTSIVDQNSGQQEIQTILTVKNNGTADFTGYTLHNMGIQGFGADQINLQGQFLLAKGANETVWGISQVNNIPSGYFPLVLTLISGVQNKTETQDVLVQPSSSNAQIVAANIQVSDAGGQPSESLDLEINNTGNVILQGVSASINSAPFSYGEGSTYASANENVNILPGKSSILSIPIHASEHLLSNSVYPVSFTLTYINQATANPPIAELQSYGTSMLGVSLSVAKNSTWTFTMGLKDNTTNPIISIRITYQGQQFTISPQVSEQSPLTNGASITATLSNVDPSTASDRIVTVQIQFSDLTFQTFAVPFL